MDTNLRRRLRRVDETVVVVVVDVIKTRLLPLSSEPPPLGLSMLVYSGCYGTGGWRGQKGRNPKSGKTNTLQKLL